MCETSPGYYPTEPPADWDKAASTAVTRLVLGSLDGGKEWMGNDRPVLPENLLELFPNLTHLHLWQVPVERLPPLPIGLRWLDVRDCPQLTELQTLPAKLECLILRNCPKFEALPLAEDDLPRLRDLDVKSPLPGATAAWLSARLNGHPALVKVRLEGVPLQRWNRFPETLEELSLNHCEDLVALPVSCPPALRRLELEDTGVTGLPQPVETLDYVNLRGTKKLNALPAAWCQRLDGARPRTLFLKGSALRRPPASQHGADGEENVAEQTWRYFRDIQRFGQGEVKRAKLLVLGNGHAGKTFFSLAMTPGKDPREADRLGTTHGILFWPWDAETEEPFRCQSGGKEHRVDLQLWDFGGQEIYHNAHRLFMETGAVFAVLWDPDQDQDGREAPLCPDTGYQDRWRPLRYWLDFIYQSNAQARVVVVCAKQGAALTKEQNAAWKKQTAGLEGRDLQCWCLPHLSDLEPDEKKWPDLTTEAVNDWLQCQEGYGALQDWLRESVASLIEAEGTVVPSYWEIAQDMVESWWRLSPEAGALVADYQTLKQERFRLMLEEAIASAIQEGTAHEKLAEVGEVPLQEEERVTQVLSFLTASGWLYWDKRLAGEQIIVDQRRALEAIYAIMDRTPNSRVYPELLRRGGLFTLEDLVSWGWETYSEMDRELYLSFMQRMNVCFCLVKKEDSWRKEAVYASPEHLPFDDPSKIPERVMAMRVDLEEAFEKVSGERECEDVVLESAMLHRAHWLALLTDLGERFGTDGVYAQGGCVVRNQEGQVMLIRVTLKEKESLGGTLSMTVSGPRAEARIQALVAYVRGFVPDVAVPEESGEANEVETVETTPVGPGPERRDIQKVFISYAWNTETCAYEAPVDAMVKALQPYAEIDLFRDKDRIKTKDYIITKLRTIERQQCVIVVHSDKYWKSLACQWELARVMKACLTDTGKAINRAILMVAHDDAAPASEPERYVAWWDDLPKDWPGLKKLLNLSEADVAFYKELVANCRPQTLEQLATEAKANIQEHFLTLSQVQGIHFEWQDNPEDLEQWLIAQLELNPSGDKLGDDV